MIHRQGHRANRDTGRPVVAGGGQAIPRARRGRDPEGRARLGKSAHAKHWCRRSPVTTAYMCGLTRRGSQTNAQRARCGWSHRSACRHATNSRRLCLGSGATCSRSRDSYSPLPRGRQCAARSQTDPPTERCDHRCAESRHGFVHSIALHLTTRRSERRIASGLLLVRFAANSTEQEGRPSLLKRVSFRW
jgi:hypothetical protein